MRSDFSQTVDPILLYYHGNPFKCHEEVLYLQPMIPPKRFGIFPPDRGMLRTSRCVQIFLQTCSLLQLQIKSHARYRLARGYPIIVVFYQHL